MISSKTRMKMRQAALALWANPLHRKKQSQAIKGGCAKDDFKQYCSERVKRQWLDPAFRKMRSEKAKELWTNADFRKHMSRTISAWATDQWANNAPYRHNRIQEYKRRWANPIFKAKMMTKFHHPLYKDRHREQAKRLWSDPSYREKTVRAIMKATLRRPTKPEVILNKSLESIYPGEFVYNGNNAGVVLGKCIPAFVNINGKKQVIDLFGCYWHCCKVCGYKDRQQRRSKDNARLKSLHELGWNSLVIWEHELTDILKLKNKLQRFIQTDFEDDQRD